MLAHAGSERSVPRIMLATGFNLVMPIVIPSNLVPHYLVVCLRLIAPYLPKFPLHFANRRRKTAACVSFACPLPQTVRSGSPDVSPSASSAIHPQLHPASYLPATLRRSVVLSEGEWPALHCAQALLRNQSLRGHKLQSPCTRDGPRRIKFSFRTYLSPVSISVSL